jgi:hypothetical protein
MQNQQLKVNQLSPLVAAMSQHWGMFDALMGGTPTMRAAGKMYLPQWPKEEDKAWNMRLSLATLYPAYRRTVSVLAGKPFSKEMTFGDDVPEPIKEYTINIDREGRNAHAFAYKLFEECLSHGFGGVMVDYPRVAQVEEGRVVTREYEKKIGARPYFVHITHDRILGWKCQTINGVVTLTQLRIRDSRVVDDGVYGEKTIPQTRVLRPGSWELWEKNDKDEDVLYDAGRTTLDVIPFVPFYGDYIGYMQGASPLLDLAFLNVKHWQAQSDQDTIVHVARVPILAVIGADDKTNIVVGASSAVTLPQGGDMKFVEHSGAAIGAGENALYTLEQQMVQTGAELLLIKPGKRTATEANNEAEGNKCDLQRMVERFEDSWDQCLQIMAKWLKLPEGGHASLFKDFGAANLTDATATLVKDLQASGLLTKKTTLHEMQRRAILSPDIDVDAELEAARDEAPDLGTMGLPGDPTRRVPPKE